MCLYAARCLSTIAVYVPRLTAVCRRLYTTQGYSTDYTGIDVDSVKPRQEGTDHNYIPLTGRGEGPEKLSFYVITIYSRTRLLRPPSVYICLFIYMTYPKTISSNIVLLRFVYKRTFRVFEITLFI